MNVRIGACWLMMAMCGMPLNAAPFLEGDVTDEQGRPIAGVTVKIWDCVGTCLGGKSVLSDEQGHCVFLEKPFRNSPSLAVSMPGRFEVSRGQTGPELHQEDSDIPRKVNFVLGSPAAASIHLKADLPKGWTQSLLIRSGRDAKVHRYDVDGNHVSGWDYWNFELLPRNERLHLVVVREPVSEPNENSKEAREQQRLNRKSRVEIVSPAIRLINPQRHTIRAKVDLDAASETSSIVFESITDALGVDRTAELTISDPTFARPVDAATREQGLALIERLKVAAAPWNARPPADILAYEYDVIDAYGKATHVRIDQDSPSGAGWSDIARQRGFAYMPPLRWLFSQPENVILHGVEIADDRAVLRYRLKSARGFGAGLGIGPGWNGFFTTGFSAGTIVIDVPTATVQEHRLSNGLLGQESIETFESYVKVQTGYAPQSLRIQSGAQDFRLSFRIHKDKLWLLHEASRGNPPQSTYKVENVVVIVDE